MSTAALTAWLVPLSGPTLSPIALHADTVGPAGLTVGRGEACVIQLPPDAHKVSRQHARFVYDPHDHDADGTPDSGGWRVADLGSRWGTTLNGVPLVAHKETPLHEGDLVRITPWTFSFTRRGVPTKALQAADDLDLNTTFVRSFGPHAPPPADRIGEDRLKLLLEAADAIHAAVTEADLANVVIDGVLRGTGLTHAAVLRPLDAEGRLHVIASRGRHGDGPATFSRTLINAANDGNVAELSAAGVMDASQSMLRLGITAAVCAPLTIGGTVAAYLYVDDRGGTATAAAAAYCTALSRMAGLALANLKRIEIEKRQAALELDLSAAARAQKWVLPPREVRAGPFTVTGESRAGAYVGGDFFDVIDLGDGRTVVALGDVSGHGVASSVLMTAAQGFLHAALRRRGEGVAEAVTDLNRFVFPRRPSSSFLTLWVALFDKPAGRLTYVNAGHGYALLSGDDGGDCTMLDGGEDFPIGFDEAAVYRSVETPLPDGGRVTVVSDGIVEQFDNATPRTQFGVEQLKRVVCGKDDPVSAIFTAVIEHAGTDRLQDDATAVVVGW